MTTVVVLIATLALVLLLAVAGADLLFLSNGSHPLDERLRAWSRRYTLYATAIVGLAGALVGHFFWQ